MQQENINRLLIGPVSERIESQDCWNNLTTLFQNAGWAANYPRMMNSFASRRLLDRIQVRLGRVFLPFAPDYTFCAAALSMCDEMLWIDRPLAVTGYADKSIGAAQIYTRGKAHDAFASEFSAFSFSHTPLQLPTLTNITTDAIMKVKASLGSQLDSIELDWGTYYARCHLDLELLAANGVDVSGDLRVLEMRLAEEPESVRRRAKVVIDDAHSDQPGPLESRSLVRRVLLRTVARFPTLVRLREALRGSRQSPRPPAEPQTANGDEVGFSDILECARWLGRAIEYMEINPPSGPRSLYRR